MLIRLTLLVSLSLLSACATYSTSVRAPVSTSSPAVERDTGSTTDNQPAAIISPQPDQVPPDPEPLPGRSVEPGTPASTLLASVDDAIAAGDLERAAALSERALRITPNDAYLWYRLAEIRYQQRQYSNAEGFARRALSFAGNDRGLSQEINQLLGRIGEVSR